MQDSHSEITKNESPSVLHTKNLKKVILRHHFQEFFSNYLLGGKTYV